MTTSIQQQIEKQSEQYALENVAKVPGESEQLYKALCKTVAGHYINGSKGYESLLLLLLSAEVEGRRWVVKPSDDFDNELSVSGPLVNDPVDVIEHSASVQAKLMKAQEENAELKDQNSALEEEIANINRRMNCNISEAYHSDKDERIAALSDQLMKGKSAYAVLDLKYCALKKRLLDFEGMTFSENEKIQTLEKRNAELEKELSQKDAVIKELTNQRNYIVENCGAYTRESVKILISLNDKRLSVVKAELKTTGEKE